MTVTRLSAALLLGLAVAAPAFGQMPKSGSDESGAGLRMPLVVPPSVSVSPAPSPTPAPSTAAAVHECDVLAQPLRADMAGLDPLTDGVRFSDIRAPAARAACARALAEFPSEPRFLTFAARAAARAGDGQEAVRLYRLAADQGYVLAQFNLAVMHANGEGGLTRSAREAERLYRLAAEQGYVSAMVNLGQMYAVGAPGIRRDDREAVRLFRTAADTGDTAGLTNLANMYAEGRGGLPRDMREAGRLWRNAAAAGSVEARNNLRRAGLGS